MNHTSKGRLIVLAGPSCVGKSPLSKALRKFYPAQSSNLQTLVLYNSREPRPGEVEGEDYHFRTDEKIKALGSEDHFIGFNVRGDLQALDLKELKEDLKKNDVFFEGNPFVGHELLKHPELQSIKKVSAFMSPLSADEIQFFKTLEPLVHMQDLVTDIMRRKLLRRTRKQKGELGTLDLENIEKRASSAFNEMKFAPDFDYVIPNHDGEDSEHWDAFYYPIGDARRSLVAFHSLLIGKPLFVEKWDKDLV